MMDALAMGGYAGFVWSAYGITIAVLIICIVGGRIRHTKTLNDVRRRIRAMAGKS